MIQKHQIGYIKKKDNNYTTIKQHILKSLRNHQLIPILGAGISMSPPSYLPSAGDITNPITELLLKSINDLNYELENKSKTGKDLVKKAKYIIKKTRMERLFEALNSVYKNVGLTGFYALDGIICNDNHKSIAILSKNNFLPVCITLNFDILIEKALDEINGTFETIVPLFGQKPVLTNFNGSKLNLKVIKPHGTFKHWDEKHERLEYIYGTISKAGDIPQIENLNELKKHISNKVDILVAGYSDNDWDIFPIIQDFERKELIDKVFWIQYKTLEKLDTKVCDWINKLGNRGKILVGDPINFFKDIIEELGIKPPQIVYIPNNKILPAFNISSFIELLSSDKLYKKLPFVVGNILAAWTEYDYLTELLNYIEKNNSDDKNILYQCYLRKRGSLFMKGEYTNAIKFNHKSINTHIQSSLVDYEILSDQYMWLGYTYFNSALKNPFNIFKGFYFLRKAVSIEKKHTQSQRVKEISCYYKLDLFHKIAETIFIIVLMCKLSKFVYRCLAIQYKRLFKRYPSLEKVEYYWMRKLECELISGIRKDSFYEENARLDFYENAFPLTYNQTHIGNVYLFKALLLFIENRDKILVKEYIDKAEKFWLGKLIKEYTETFPSGLRKVKVFRKIMHIK